MQIAAPLGSHRRIGAEQQRCQLLIRSGSGGTHGFLTWLTGLLDLTGRDASDRPRRPAPAAPPRPHLALGQPGHRRHRPAARPDPRLTSRILLLSLTFFTEPGQLRFSGLGSPAVPVWLIAPCSFHGLGGVAAGMVGA
jgi:hypothetical protein